MKILFAGISAIIVFPIWAQLARPTFPTNGLKIECRTTIDVLPADYDKDGRLFVSGIIRSNEALEEVIFRINKANDFINGYKSKMQDLKIKKVQLGDRSVKMIDSYSDSKFNFSITQFPSDLESLIDKNDNFSANVGLLENPSKGGFVKNYDLRCVVERK